MPAAQIATPSTTPHVALVREGRVRVPLQSSLGGPMAKVELRYRLLGDIGKGARLVLGGISATRRADGEGGWWPAQVGAGRALDPFEGAVLCVDYLGRLPAGWRGVTSQDQASAVLGVADRLGIGEFAAVVGASYGGCVALAMAEKQPERARGFLVIGAAHRPSQMAIGLRALQRRILALGSRGARGREAMAIARALAMTGYRSEAEFQARFDAPAWWDGNRWSFPVEDYLMARGHAFAGHADVRRHRLLSESLDLHRVDPLRLPGHLQLLGVRQDRLVPAEDLRALARDCGAGLALVDSRYGHDAFLKEHGRVARWLRRHLGASGRMRGRAHARHLRIRPDSRPQRTPK